MNRSRALLVLVVVLATAAAQLSGAERASAPVSGSFSADTLSNNHLYSPSVDGEAVAWADYNGDGNLDLLVTPANTGSDAGTYLYSGDGAGGFAEDAIADVNLADVYQGAVAWGDYNSDGKPDILLTGYGFSDDIPITRLYKNNGAGNAFTRDTTAEAGLTGVGNGSVAWGDYNNDGKPDILLSGYNGSGGPVLELYKNNGNGTGFTKDASAGLTSISFPGVADGSAAWGDYNNDGYLDILATGGTSLSAYGVTKLFTNNNGDGTFSENTTAGLTQVRESAAAWGDQNNDGYLDILLSGCPHYLGGCAEAPVSKVFTNGGTGTFSDASAGLQGFMYGGVAWGDYNSDGKLDILLSGSNASLTPIAGKAYTNTGSVPFSVDSTVFPATGKGTVAFGDYDNNGKLDAVLAGSYTTNVFHNDLTAADTAPSTPTNLAVSTGSNSANFSWTASTDTQQTGGLTYNLRVGTTPGGTDIVSPLSRLSDGRRLVPQAGNVGERTSYGITGLANGVYYWSVQAVDSSFAGSAFASEGMFILPPPVFSFSSAAYSVGEGDGNAAVTINRAGYAATAVSVQFATANGTATAGSDYTDASQTVNFATGETSKAVSVPITNDSAVESSETVLLSLSSPSSGTTLGSPSSATLTITDNDVAPPPATGTTPTTTSKGKIASCKLSKKSFPSSQAGKVKLTCKFSPKSKVLKYVLSLKKGAKWVVVKSAKKTGSFKTYTLTVKKLFAGKAVKRGTYRLKLSADKNSKTLAFRVT